MQKSASRDISATVAGINLADRRRRGVLRRLITKMFFRERYVPHLYLNKKRYSCELKITRNTRRGASRRTMKILLILTKCTLIHPTSLVMLIKN